LVQLRQWLALLYDIVNVHIQFFHDARGFALDLDLGDGLNLPGGNNGTRHIAAGDFGQLVGIDGGALGQPHDAEARQGQNYHSDYAQPDPECFAFSRRSHQKPSPNGKRKPQISAAQKMDERNLASETGMILRRHLHTASYASSEAVVPVVG
jgi:hypothetical protein